MNNEKLLVIYPQKRKKEGRERLDQVLDFALEGLDAEIWEDMRTLWEDVEETSCLWFHWEKTVSIEDTMRCLHGFVPGSRYWKDVWRGF